MISIQLAPIGGMSDVCATPAGWLAIVRADADVLLLVWLDRAGADVRRLIIHTGNAADNTFPRVETVVIDGVARQFVAYPAYREESWHAMLREVTGGILGDELPGGGLHSADRNGGNNSVCLSADGWFAWQDDNTRCVEGVNLRTGEQRTLRAELRPTGLASCDGGQVVFVDEARMSVPNMANPVTSGGCTVGESPTGGIAVQLASGPTGVLLPGADTNVPRCADGGAGAFATITWGKPGPAVQLIIFTADDVVAPPAPSTEVAAVGRALWLGFIRFGETETTSPENCELHVDADMLVRRHRDRVVIAQYVAAEADGTIEGLELAIAAKKIERPGVPTLCYWTRGAQSQRVPIGAEIVGVEAYRRLGEPLDRFEARVRDAVAVCQTAWLIAQCYTSNAGNDPDLRVLVPVYARIMRDCRNVQGVLVFSAGSRDTGWESHPEVHALWQQVAASLTGEPNLPSAPVTPPVLPVPKPTPIPKPVPAPLPAPSPVQAPPFLAHARTFGGPMKVFLMFGGRYVGISPTAIPHQIGDSQFLPYHDREKGGGWEGVELTKHDDGSFDARFLDSDRQLSINNNGGLESRPAGTNGPWERLHASTQPEQPADGSRGILYRTDDAGHIIGTPLTIEAAE